MAQRGLADVVLGHDLWRGRRHLHLPSSDANDRIREIGKCRQREFGAVLLASTGHRRARDRGCERLESLRVDQRRQPTEPEGAGVRVCRILAALLRLHQLGNHPTLGDQLNGQCGCLTHPGDTRPDRRIASRIAQCHQPAEGARDRSGQGRDPAAAGNLHRRTLVPFDGTAVERPDSLKHILVVLAAQIVPCRPRNDPAVGSGLGLKLHGADIKALARLPARHRAGPPKGAARHLVPDPSTQSTGRRFESSPRRDRTARGHAQGPSRRCERMPALPQRGQAAARGCLPRHPGSFRESGPRHRSRGRRGGPVPTRRSASASTRPDRG